MSQPSVSIAVKIFIMLTLNWLRYQHFYILPQDFLLLRFRRPAGGWPEVAVETSPELTTWTRGEAHLTLTALERDPGGIWETVECRTLAPLPAEGQSHAYWRLKVTPPP